MTSDSPTRPTPTSLVLFEADPTKVLAAQVRDEFRAKGTVTGLQVRTFVENRTAYLKKHMTAALKHEEESGHLTVDEIKTDGKKRRANTFPDEARLTWA